MKLLTVILIFFLYEKSAIAQPSNSKFSVEQGFNVASQKIEEAIAQEASCEKAFVDLSKTIEELESNRALQKDIPLVEIGRNDLISKGYVFPRPLDPNDSETIHSALNKGAVILDLNSSVTSEIAKKMRNAIVSAKLVLKFLNFLFHYSDFGTSNLRTRSFVKTGKISEEEIGQFYKELHQITRELETAISAADGRSIRFTQFTGQATDKRPITSSSGHRHTMSNSWVSVTYTIFGPAGTLFKTKDGQPAITLPGQALLFPERKRNKTILGDIEPLPLHATPRLPGERLVLVLSFQEHPVRIKIND